MIKPRRREQASPQLQEIREREQAFLKRARAGENIRDEAILSLQPTIRRMAYRLYARISSQSPTLKAIEQNDLEQEAYTRMLAQFPKALSQEEPFRWLTGVAYGAMRDCLNGRRDLIRRHTEERAIPVLRLDRILTEDGCSLEDVLPTGSRHSHDLPESLLMTIEQALTVLPMKQRMVIEHHFGLHEHAPVSLNEISRRLGQHSSASRQSNALYHYKRALLTLRQALSDMYPDSQQDPQQAKAAGGTRS